MSTIRDKAWAAGFFDGEGCVYISKIHNGERPRPSYCLVISASQARTKKPLVKLQKMFGGKIYQKEHRNGNRTWLMYEWNVRAGLAELALEEMLPYLVVKKDQARVAIRFQRVAAITRHQQYQDLTQHEIAYRKLQELKRK